MAILGVAGGAATKMLNFDSVGLLTGLGLEVSENARGRMESSVALEERLRGKEGVTTMAGASVDARVGRAFEGMNGERNDDGGAVGFVDDETACTFEYDCDRGISPGVPSRRTGAASIACPNNARRSPRLTALGLAASSRAFFAARARASCSFLASSCCRLSSSLSRCSICLR
jgi:hypothetical protein